VSSKVGISGEESGVAWPEKRNINQATAFGAGVIGVNGYQIRDASPSLRCARTAALSNSAVGRK